MAVRLRLALSGKRHNRIYHIVAAHHRLRRDGKPIETLGLFDPHLAPGEKTRIIEWSADRIRYWLGVGAQPSPAVSKLLVLVSSSRSIRLNRHSEAFVRVVFRRRKLKFRQRRRLLLKPRPHPQLHPLSKPKPKPKYQSRPQLLLR